MHRARVMSVLALSTPASAAVPDYGYEWSVVGARGNAPITYPLVGGATRTVGRVDYEFRITRTEVFGSQWLEFVHAYSPHLTTGEAWSGSFTSGTIGVYSNPDGSVGHYQYPQLENNPIDVDWRYAATYCNWLHNAKGGDLDSFLYGAYDLRTWGQPNQPFVDPFARLPGARFWIPSQDEWVKAAFYDPDRHGENQGGYWTYPHASDTPPIPGWPEDGGQTLAGIKPYPDTIPYPLRVGLFPDVQSPWGLLDLSGGVTEWCEDPSFSIDNGALLGRRARGSQVFHPLWDLVDGVGYELFGSSNSYGFRVASAIPAPGVWPGCFLFLIFRGRRCGDASQPFDRVGCRDGYHGEFTGCDSGHS